MGRGRRKPQRQALDAAALARVAALADLIVSATGRLALVEERMQEGRATRAYLAARIAEAQQIIDGLLSLQGDRPRGALVDWAQDSIPATYRTGAAWALDDLLDQGLRPTAGSAAIHTRAVNALVNQYARDATQIVVQLHANTIRSSRLVLAQAGFAPDIAAGMIGGLPRRETSKMLTRSLREAATGALPEGTRVDLTHIEVNGRRMALDTWAEQHARTATATASTGGTRSLCEANGVGHVQITAHAHPPCICTPFEGRVYRLREDDDSEFPWIGDVPDGGCPMHPNCVHREAPAVVAYMRERGDLDERTEIPEDFRGKSAAEIARMVREHREQLRPFAEDRDGMLPRGFKLDRAA